MIDLISSALFWLFIGIAIGMMFFFWLMWGYDMFFGKTITEFQKNKLIDLLLSSATEFWETEGIDGFTEEERKDCDRLIELYKKKK